MNSPNRRFVHDLLQWAAIVFPSALQSKNVDKKTDCFYQVKIRFSTHHIAGNADTLKSLVGGLTFDIETRGLLWKRPDDYKPTKTPHAGDIGPSQAEQLAAVIRAVKHKQEVMGR